MDNLMEKKSSKSFEIKNGIYYYIPEQELSWNDEWTKKLISKNLIEGCWELHKSNKYGNILTLKAAEAAKKIIDHGGIILEIGTGLGGGFMPYVLKLDKSARIIISDLCPTVCIEWKKIFEKEYFPKNITYAVLDNCELPFFDESIDIISSCGGLVNIETDKIKALKEFHRVLKKGGIFIDSGVSINNEYLSTLSNDFQNKIKEKFSVMFNDYLTECYDVGFDEIINIEGEKIIDKDPSYVNEFCKQYGIFLLYNTYLRYCIK